MKSGNINFLEPSGPLQACNGTALTFTFLTSILMQFTHFHVHIHVEDVVKIVIKLALIANVHFVGLYYIIISRCAVQKTLNLLTA